ncbi:UPF0280 family protein [Lichenihabitans sp. PAMC28606]|uniref:UPF0280 family protein n=1 Tax=Lichenihabitans sp. PAMC28606 TaxID=2880932 RepID=UPI001D0BE15B|nr:UPF0280 family protein [Lichenihabitans sp. PAMC28606]UDL96009.1 UPF0280 family protein [Lichenihabitans sp. PAMC28606]
MRAPPQIRFLPDGHRLHLQDGPIDLVIGAFGAHEAVRAAYRAAADRFVTILDELCVELPALRARSRAGDKPMQGQVARAMQAAVAPFAPSDFITPMAAVAGAVADAVLSSMGAAATLERAYVNNGGDIALLLGPEAAFTIGMVDRPDRPSLFGDVRITAADPMRGLATSGWRGRSFSRGIADAVTVLAATAAEADAAATMIANAIDLPAHPAVRRAPAASIQPDNDLGSRLVTREVGPLTRAEIDRALAGGAACARDLERRGLVHGASLHLQGVTRVIGAVPSLGAKPTQTTPSLFREHAYA